jgi:hypothetical protein
MQYTVADASQGHGHNAQAELQSAASKRADPLYTVKPVESFDW